jgi:hypothetical protein
VDGAEEEARELDAAGFAYLLKRGYYDKAWDVRH